MEFLFIILVICALLLLKFNRVILLVIKHLKHKPFPYNPNKREQLSVDQQNALSTGLIITEQNMFCCDSLESDASNSGKTEQRYRLRNGWGIYSSESAIKSLSSFGSTHKLYDIAIEIYLKVPKEHWQSCIDEQIPDQFRQDILAYCSQLDNVCKVLLKNKGAKDEDEINQILHRGTIAWDLGRLVYIARASYVAGYINKDQAWQSINSVLPILKQSFSDWKAFGQSYMLGRAMWSHDDSGIYGLFDIYQQCVTSEQSPWIKFPLNN